MEYLHFLSLAALLFYTVVTIRGASNGATLLLGLPVIVLLAVSGALTYGIFDVGTYFGMYQGAHYLPDWVFGMSPEWGYQATTHLAVTVFGWTFEQFRFFYFLIILAVLFFSARAVTELPALYLLLYYPKYFLIGLISHSRSGFVNAFMFFMIDWTVRGLYRRVAIGSLLLSQFHTSALAYLMLPFINRVPLNTWLFVGVLPVAVLVNMFLPDTVHQLIASTGYEKAHQFSTDIAERGRSGVFELIRRLILLSVCFYSYWVGRSLNGVDRLLLRVFVASLFFYYGFYSAPVISDRVGGMLGFVEPMLWIVLIRAHLNGGMRTIAFFVAMGYVAVDFYLRWFYLADGPPAHYPLAALWGG